MELGRKSRARQPMATKFSSDRGLSQEMRGKRVGEDLLSEDQRRIKKEKWRSESLSSCPLPVRRSVHSPASVAGVLKADRARYGSRWAWPTGQSYGANMAGTLEAFMDMERCLLEWVDLALQPSPASSRDPDPCFSGTVLVPSFSGRLGPALPCFPLRQQLGEAFSFHNNRNPIRR